MLEDEEPTGRIGIAVAVDRTDWTQYAGQASSVKRRGERRKRRLQAGTALATTVAVIAVAVVANGLGKGAMAQQGASQASNSDYPTFPAKLPTRPQLFSSRNVQQSGVIGAGAVSGHQWQIAYRVTSSGSATGSQSPANDVDITVDGKTVSIGGSQGTDLSPRGYTALDQDVDQHPGNTSSANTIVVGYGTPSPGVTSVDLRWTNGAVVQIPIHTVTGTRFASFAWNLANPPAVIEQVSVGGVQTFTITHSGYERWEPQEAGGKQPSPIPGTPPAVHVPAGTPNLSQTPQVTKLASGLLGEGTVAGHSWQVAYEIIPSGSAENDSNEVFCTEATVDATTEQGGGCTSSKPFSGRLQLNYTIGEQSPLVVGWGAGEPGTTSLGLEWADGTKVVNAMQYVEGNPMAAVAFAPDNPPSYLVEYGDYGEYRIPLTTITDFTWTFTPAN